MQISKSDYMLYLRHPAWLWLKKNDKDKLPAIDAGLQAFFDTGFLFETYAEQRFPDAVRLGFDGYKDYLTLPSRTEQALQNGAKTIFQGRFEYNQFTFICDVIDVIEGKTVDLYEIKSSTGANASHQKDLAFQLMVLNGCGYTVRNIAVIHVNNQYVRHGDIDPSQLSAITDVTEPVIALLPSTVINTDRALSTANLKQCPDMSPLLAGDGAFKEWLDIYKSINPPQPGSILELGGINAKSLQILQDNNIQLMTDIPETMSVSSTIDKQLRAYRNQKPIIDAPRIRQFLYELVFPLYFFDYETMASLIPYFDGMRPYTQYPFQYSLHILDSPDAELRHAEYLHTENSNPAEAIVAAMQSHFGDRGSIITWNMSFEKGCNDTLAQFVPSAGSFLNDLNNRIVDLMTPFSSGAYVDYRFKGSASIKNVLPVLCPELSYKSLDIQEGASAQRIWMQTVLEGKNEDTKQKILNDLLEYCKLDTLAMVEIYKTLLNI